MFLGTGAIVISRKHCTAITPRINFTFQWCDQLWLLITFFFSLALVCSLPADWDCNRQALLCCSVRFGLVGGKMRLLVASQGGGAYIFEVGPGPLDSASKEMACQELIASQKANEDAEEVPQQLRSNHQEVQQYALY